MTIANSSPTNAARRRGEKADADSSSQAGSDQIIVLIRLPNLSSEPSSVQHAVDKPVLAPPPAAPTAAATVPQPPVLAAADSSRETKASVESPTQPLIVSMTKLANGTKQYLTRMRIPKQAWKTGSVVLVLALILFALLALRGGNGRSPAGSNDLAAGASPELEFPEVPPPGLPAIPGTSRHAKPPVEPAARTAAVPAKQTGEVPPLPERGAPEPNAPASAPKAPQLEPMVPQDDSKEDRNGQPATPPDAALPLSGPGAEATAPAEPASTAAETTSRDSVYGNSAAPADTATPPSAERPVEGLTNWPPDGSPANSVQPNYPATEPSTYQYPSRYEQLFAGAPQGPDAQNQTSSNDQSSIYGWQPNTARLQPRIEPPPIR